MQPYSSSAAAGDARSADNVLRVIRVVALLLFAAWVWRYMREPDFLLHGSILVFHEAGHVLFIPFGEFMSVLGGSLFQLMVPAFLVGYFIWRRDFFAACFAILYLAASMDDLALYIADARAGDLPLLGGERSNHDWTYLLIELKLLDHDIAIGRFVERCALTLFWPTLIAGLWLGWQGKKEPDREVASAASQTPSNIMASNWRE